MSDYRTLTDHGNPAPTIPKPEITPLPAVLTVQDGLPVIYGAGTEPTCGIRVIHPTNPKSRSKNHSIAMLYVPPHAKLDLHNHEAEETYCILSGTGVLMSREGRQDIVGHELIAQSTHLGCNRRLPRAGLSDKCNNSVVCFNRASMQRQCTSLVA